MTQLLEGVSPAQRTVIDQARGIAARLGVPVYLVGGPVRDLLLGRPTVDIDLMLESRVETFSRELAVALGGKLKRFDRFLTFKVIVPDIEAIDIATTRTENYEVPGSLPEVRRADVQSDLYRRDFSINALAYDLNSNELVDATGGVSDLENGRFRVLHDQSFIDDPTRIFRAVRLSTRLGFTIEPHSRTLLESAISTGCIHTVSRERMWRELVLAASEQLAPAVLARLANSQALRAVFSPAVSGDVSGSVPPPPEAYVEDLLSRARRIAASTTGIDLEGVWFGLLAAFTRPDASFDRSGMTRSRIKRALEVASNIRAGFESGEFQREGSLSSLSSETLVALAAFRTEMMDACTAILNARAIQLDFQASDLNLPPGPHLGAALRRTREAIATGEIAPAGALHFARAAAVQYLHEGTPDKS